MRAYFATNAVTSSGLHLNSPEVHRDCREAPSSVTDGVYRRAISRHSGRRIGRQKHHFGKSSQSDLCCCDPDASLGAIVLVAMWIAHFMLFLGSSSAAWIGIVVVIENVVSSAVNSNLFDFSQGWLYVFGIGIVGGMV